MFNAQRRAIDHAYSHCGFPNSPIHTPSSLPIATRVLPSLLSFVVPFRAPATYMTLSRILTEWYRAGNPTRYEPWVMCRCILAHCRVRRDSLRLKHTPFGLRCPPRSDCPAQRPPPRVPFVECRRIQRIRAAVLAMTAEGKRVVAVAVAATVWVCLGLGDESREVCSVV